MISSILSLVLIFLLWKFVKWICIIFAGKFTFGLGAIPVKKAFDTVEWLAMWPIKKFFRWLWLTAKTKIPQWHAQWPWPTRIGIALSAIFLLWLVGSSFYYDPW